MRILKASRNGRNWLWRVMGDHDQEYIVQFIRQGHQKRFLCECRDFLIRRFAKKKLCKHAKHVLAQVRLAGGATKLQELIEMGHLPHDGGEHVETSLRAV